MDIPDSTSALTRGLSRQIDQTGRSQKAPPERAQDHQLAGDAVRVTLSDRAQALQITQDQFMSKMGERIQAMFEEAGIEFSEAVGVDYSPEATATRIFEGSTQFLQTFSQQNPNMSDPDRIDAFESALRSGIERGYGDAIEVLESMQLDDEVLDISAQTKSLLDAKLDQFFAGLRGETSQGQSADQLPAAEG